MHFPILFADLFDRLRLQLPDPIVNWLTPVWILCVGAALGLIVTAVLWGVFWLLSRVPGIGTLADQPGQRRVAIGVLTVVFFAVLAGLYLSFLPVAGAAVANAQPLDRVWALVGCLVAGWIFALGTVVLSSRKALDETNIALREGVLWPLLVTALVMAGCAVFGLFVVRKPMELLDSLVRWPVLAAEGDKVFVEQLEAPPSAFDDPAEQIFNVNFRRDEIRALSITSDQHVRLRSEPFTAMGDAALMLNLDVPANETKLWRR
jgi:hypothetical protein